MGRRSAVTVMACVAVLLAGELGARGIEADLPAVLEWHSAEAERKVERMDELGDRGADVVFLGSSLANAGFVPETFVAGTTVPGSEPPIAYNAGLSAGMPLVTERWAGEVVVPRLHPRLVVIGVSSFDFTDHPSVDLFYEAFRTSPAGQRAIEEDGVLDRADRWLDDRSALWRNKLVLRDPGLILDAIRGHGPAPDPVLEAMGPFGRTGYLETQRFEDRVDDGGVGVPVDSWSLGRRNPAALERLVERLHDEGATVVLVDMPVTDEYVLAHPRGVEDYDLYLRYLRGFGERLGVPVIEMDTMRDHALFADEVHLNIDGATVLTNAVVARIVELGLTPAGT